MRSGLAVSMSLLAGLLPVLGLTTSAAAQTDAARAVESIRRVGYEAELAGEPEIAESMWQQAIEQEPDAVDHYIWLGHAHLQQEEWAKAESVFSAGIALPTFDSLRNPEALYLGLGQALRAQGKFTEAKAALQTAISLNNQSPFGYFALGRLHRDYGELAEAAAVFNTILQRQPAGPYGAEAYWNLGRTLVAQDKLPEAELAYRRAIGLSDEDVRFWQSLLTVLNRQGGSPQLAEIASTISRLKSDSAGITEALETRNLLAEEYEIGLYRTQAAELQRVVNRYPETVSVYLELGNALRKIGQFADAEAAYQQALALSPENPLAHHDLSEVLADLGRTDEAKVAYQVALSLYPAVDSRDDLLAARPEPQSLYQFSGPLGAQLPDPAEPPPALAMTANAAAEPPRRALAPSVIRRPSSSTPFRLALPSTGARRTPTSIQIPRTARTARSSSERVDPLLEQIRLNPDDAVLQGKLGERLYRQDEFESAAIAFRKMAKLDPRYAHLAYHNLAIALRQQQQPDLAKLMLRQALEAADTLLEPASAVGDTLAQITLTYQVLGDLLTEQAAWEELAAHYQSAIERSLPAPSNRSDTYWHAQLQTALTALARTQYAQGNLDGAEAAYRALIREQADTQTRLNGRSITAVQAVDELATLLFNQGKLQSAEAVYREAIAASRSQARQLYRGLEIVLRAQNREQEADELVATYQPVPGTISLLPLPQQAARRSRVAISTVPALPPTFRSTISLAQLPPLYGTYVPLISQAYYSFGQSRLSEGRYSFASFALREALNRSNGYTDALIVAGLANNYTGDPITAESLYAQVVSSDPNAIRCYIVPPEVADTAWQPEDYLQTGETCLPLLLK